MALYRCGGGVNNTPVQPILIGTYAINNTSVVTRTLTESIAGYKYLWFSMAPITSNTVWIAATAGHTGYGFVDVDYFRNNTVTLLYTSGTSGQSTNQTVLLSYVDDTTFTSKASVNSGRTLYVYGIKDMPHGGDQKIAIGTFTASTSAQTTVSLGFRPKYLCVRQYGSDPTTPYIVYICDDRFSLTDYQGAGSGSYLAKQAYGQSNNHRIYGLTDDGFIFNKVSSGYTNCAYFAIG